MAPDVGIIPRFGTVQAKNESLEAHHFQGQTVEAPQTALAASGALCYLPIPDGFLPHRLAPGAGEGQARPSGPAGGAEPPSCLTSLDTYGITDEIGLTVDGQSGCSGPHGETCGKWMLVVCAGCAGPVRWIYKACEDRFRCRQCRKGWMRDTYHRFMPVIDAMVGAGGYVRFLTVTTLAGPDLRERYEHLKAGFKRLKQQVGWKRHVEGAIRVLEFDKGPHGWLCHYHILMTGCWWDQAEIKAAWLKAMGDSDVVDIRMAGAGAVRELFKYTVKDGELSASELDEVARLLRGVPVVTVLGAFYRRQRRRESRAVVCEKCGGTRWIPFDAPVSWIARDGPVLRA